MTTTRHAVAVRYVKVPAQEPAVQRRRVQRVDTGKVLGHVEGQPSTVKRCALTWRAAASRSAFLGDGPGGGEPVGDHVPAALFAPLLEDGDEHLPGEHRTPGDAVDALLAYLDQQRAPAMGWPAHPAVTHTEGAR